ncbi:MAG: hypothetical protein WBP81_21255, partial [Solirubrobacteraceae bacterium]
AEGGPGLSSGSTKSGEPRASSTVRGERVPAAGACEMPTMLVVDVETRVAGEPAWSGRRAKERNA